MEIILLKDVDKVGFKHDIVSVKNGYGRNYLIPQKLGIIANASNRKRLEEFIRQEEAAELKKLDVYREMAEELKTVTLKIGAKTGTSGKIFGSVTNVQLAQAIKDQVGLDIDRRKIVIAEEIKTLGTYTAAINLHKEVPAEVSFEVMSE